MLKYFLTLCFLCSCAHLSPTQVFLKTPRAFDGTKESFYLVHGHSKILSHTKKVSLAAWIKPNRVQNVEIIAVGAANKTEMSTSRACLKINERNGLQVYARSTDAQDPRWYISTEKNNLFPSNTWTHIAAIIHFDNNKIEFFVNGNQVTTEKKLIKFAQSQTPITPSHLIAIGSEENNSGQNFSGLITHVVISNKVLDIKKLYQDKAEDL